MMTLASETPSNIGSKKPEKRVEGEIDLMAEALFFFFFFSLSHGVGKANTELVFGESWCV